MLVLGRKPGEYVMIGKDIMVKVVKSDEGDLRLAIDAPKSINIIRGEIYEDKFRYVQEEELIRIQLMPNPNIQVNNLVVLFRGGAILYTKIIPFPTQVENYATKSFQSNFNLIVPPNLSRENDALVLSIEKGIQCYRGAGDGEENDHGETSS